MYVYGILWIKLENSFLNKASHYFAHASHEVDDDGNHLNLKKIFMSSAYTYHTYATLSKITHNCTQISYVQSSTYNNSHLSLF